MGCNLLRIDVSVIGESNVFEHDLKDDSVLVNGFLRGRKGCDPCLRGVREILSPGGGCPLVPDDFLFHVDGSIQIVVAVGDNISFRLDLDDLDVPLFGSRPWDREPSPDSFALGDSGGVFKKSEAHLDLFGQEIGCF